MNMSSQTITTVIAGVILMGFGAMAGYYTMRHINREDSIELSSDTRTKPTVDAEAKVRDSIRREHVATMATSLFTKALILNETVSADQQGMDTLTTTPENDRRADPSTKFPYTYNPDQDTLAVGQAHFRIGGSCDNKVIGSDGIGKIVDRGSGYVAVNTMLESGEYYCESNL